MTQTLDILLRLKDEGSKGFEKFAATTKLAFGDVESAAKSAQLVVAGAVAGIGTAAVAGAGLLVSALADATTHLIDLGGTLTDLSLKTGTSIEFLQKVGFAAAQNGSSMEQAAASVTIMQRNLVGAGEAGSEGAQAFARLGLSVSDLKAMRPEEAFVQVGEAIKNIKNPTEQAAAAMAVFGRAGAEMLPMLKSGLADAMAQAEELGFVMSSQTAAAADALGDAVDALGMTWEGLKNNVASVIVQNASLHAFIEEGTTQLGRWSKAINGNTNDLGSLVSDGVVLFARSLVGLLEVGSRSTTGRRHSARCGAAPRPLR